MSENGGAQRACPLCGSPLYGWLTLPGGPAEATVGRPMEPQAGARVLERCESCGVGVERGGTPVDLEAEVEGLATTLGDGRQALTAPNRSSLQATLGGEGWAAIDLRPGRLILTPASLRLLAERTGRELVPARFPRLSRNQAWMWQTLLNGLTFHPNFAREVRAGRLRPATARSQITFAVDCVVTVLAAPLVLLASVPIELGAAVARRGGEMVAALRAG